MTPSRLCVFLWTIIVKSIAVQSILKSRTGLYFRGFESQFSVSIFVSEQRKFFLVHFLNWHLCCRITSEWAAPAGCGLLSRRAGPERAYVFKRWECWDSEEAQPCQPPALPMFRRPAGTENLFVYYKIWSTRQQTILCQAWQWCHVSDAQGHLTLPHTCKISAVCNC